MPLMLAGLRFGKLVVTNHAKSVWKHDRKRRFWHCVCDCGAKLWVEASNLNTGNSAGCNICWRVKHGHAVREHGQSRTYKSWAAMLSRCRDKNVEGYYLYGGRGITVSKRWNQFENFLADMGARPIGKTIERKNSDGNYHSRNCYWATTKEQGYNRRNVKLSFAKAAKIRKLHKKGIIRAEIARQFDMSFAAIARVVDGSRWSAP